MSATAQAQSNVPQHFLFDGRALWSSNFQSKLEQDLTAGNRVSVKFEDDLGITSAWGPQLRAIWKITSGNRIRFDYRRLEHSGEKVIDKDIPIDDIVFPAGSRVGASVGGGGGVGMNSGSLMPIFSPLEVDAFGAALGSLH